MDEWKKWLNADYAFSNNGEKIKKVVKASYTISLVLFFIAAAFGFIGVLGAMFDGAFEYLWYVPLLIIVAVMLAPFLIYWSLSTVYGFGELISNSYGNGNSKVIEKAKEEKITNSESENKESVKKFRCPKCKTSITTEDEKCPGCGAAFDWSKI